MKAVFRFISLFWAGSRVWCQTLRSLFINVISFLISTGIFLLLRVLGTVYLLLIIAWSMICLNEESAASMLLAESMGGACLGRCSLTIWVNLSQFILCEGIGGDEEIGESEMRELDYGHMIAH